MTEQEIKVLDPSIAFKLGKIVAIDEILSLMEDTVTDNQGISGKALAIAVRLIYSSIEKRLSEEVTAAYES